MDIPVGIPFPVHIFSRARPEHHTFFYLGFVLPTIPHPIHGILPPVQLNEISESGLEDRRSMTPPDQ